eukprot:COSAG05_NODE_1027_length_6117_cov_7.351778_11_plen_94_part_00
MPLHPETPANAILHRRRRQQLLETAAAQANAEAAGLDSSIGQGWWEGLWCPAQLDPWWGAPLPPADAGRIWFRQVRKALSANPIRALHGTRNH